ncbi:energy transducer TonB [Poseidonibacter lekithochrous]|uniref:energy transducer TonB n=1 Tax=Poseidonibacter TaxID=2321187 RepID=UPI001C09B5ED|nr:MULTISPECIES: energy transducer TonB [Poseidonibacter]MBU3014879.1 energy transducer TonB [Poseidonibacter lekithochrous]MDO6828177.1 energy transducer TonB [Poseidonibacter sp. 1_MG-2023]
MENKKSLLIIFMLITTVHIVLFAQLKVEEKVASIQNKPTPNISKINLKNVVIKKPEPKPEPVVEKVVETPVEIKPLPKTKSKNIIKHKKKKKKKIVKKVEKPTKKIETPKKVEVAETPVLEQSSQKSIQKKVVLDSSKIKALENEYLAKLRHLIEKNKIYPKSAKRLRQMGKVHISFVITKDGHIKDAKILRNSKYKRLNKAAIAILSNINKFEPIPKKLNRNSWEITVPIVYEIIRS